MIGTLPLLDGFVACPGRFLWHPESRTTLCADLHLGAEAALARQGIYLPDVSTAALCQAWQRMVAANPARVVIAGDLFHSPDPENAAIELLREFLRALPSDCQVQITPGNHDPDPAMLTEISAARISVVPAVDVAGYTVFHGHQSADARGIGQGGGGGWHGRPDAPDRIWIPRGLIVGHQHPAVTLHSAKMICFVAGHIQYLANAIPLILLPAFSTLPLGSNLLNDRNWILDLPRPADKDLRIAGLVEPASAPAQVLDFGPLSLLATL